jgi:hypothetical protein
VRSWTEQGSTSAIHNGSLPGADSEVAGVLVGLAGVPGVDGFALDAEPLLGAAIDRDQGAVKDHVRQSFCLGAAEGLVQVGCLSCEDFDAFVQESRDVLNECAGDVERGTMSNHGALEPFGLERSYGETSSTGAPLLFPAFGDSSRKARNATGSVQEDPIARTISLRSSH